MALKETEEVLKRLKSRPRPTLLLLVAVLAVVAGGAFVMAYFSEAGRQAAAVSNAQAEKVASTEKAPAASTGKSARAPRGALKIRQVTYGTGRHRNAVNISVQNSWKQPIVIKEILVFQSYWDAPDCLNCARSFDVYRLAADATRDGSAIIAGSFRDLDDPEFDYPVSGSLVTADRIAEVALRIAVSVPVAPNSTEIVQLLIPVHVGASAQVRAMRGHKRDSYLALSKIDHLLVRLCTSAGEASFSATLNKRGASPRRRDSFHGPASAALRNCDEADDVGA